MVKLVAANGDVLFHLESTEESAEIYKFPESGYAASLLEGRATNTFWQQNARITDVAQLEQVTRTQERLANLQREMDRVLGQQIPLREMTARVQFTGEQIAAARRNTGAFARIAQEDAQRVAQQALYAENLRRIDEMREYANAQETEEQEG
jgi:hypothetical protein